MNRTRNFERLFHRITTLGLASGMLAACGGDDPGTGGTPADSGATSDARVDSGVTSTDAGDSGVADAGSADASTADTSTGSDAGGDATVFDGGAADAAADGAADAAPGVDRSGFPDSVCTNEEYEPLAGVTFATPVDYVELRREFQSSTGLDAGAAGIYVSVRARLGNTCATATDSEACKANFNALRTQQGWGPASGAVQIVTFEYLAYTRGDTVAALTTPAALSAAIAPINTRKDAALVAISHGHRIPCASGNNARSFDSGYELITQTGIACGEGTHEDEHVVRVAANGAFSIVQTVRLKDGDPGCAIGRRPDGLHLPAKCPSTPLGSYFAAMTHLEAAAVLAFDRLIEELTHYGAPSALVERARRARADEVRHTAMTAKLARRFGATVSEPTVDALPIRDLPTIAIENAIEGCVRETFGALVATLQSARATDTIVKRTMRVIARDETRHAALSWDVAEWLDSKMTAAERSRVRAAQNAAASELRSELRFENPDQVLAVTGTPNAAESLALFDQLAPSLWAA